MGRTDTTTSVGADALLEAVGVPVLVVDAERRVVEGNGHARRLLARFWAAADASLFGPEWAPVDSSGADLPEAKCPPALTLASGAPSPVVELGVRDVAGGLRWLDASAVPFPGRPDRALVTIVDVTAERRARDDLVREQERRRVVDETIHDGVVRQDRDGRLVSVNARASEILGVDLQARIGRGPGTGALELLDEHGEPMGIDQLPSHRVLATGRSSLGGTVGVRLDGGPIRWVRINATPVHDVDGTISGVVSTLEDVTEARLQREEQQRTTNLFATAFAEAPIGMALVGLDGSWLRVNAALCDLLGHPEDELLTRTFQDLTHPDDLLVDLSLLEDTLAGRRRGYQLQKRYLHADGHVVWTILSVSLICDEHGRPLHFVSQLKDITQQRRLEDRLRRLAESDHLTGLPNRRRFIDDLTTRLADLPAAGRAALALLDLDGLKAVNDAQGHAAGDSLLRSAAHALRRHVASTGTAGRLGGDEFAVIVDATDRHDVAEVSRDLTTLLARHGIAASVGATWLAAGDSPRSALSRADQAMYDVKRARKAAVL